MRLTVVVISSIDRHEERLFGVIHGDKPHLLHCRQISRAVQISEAMPRSVDQSGPYRMFSTSTRSGYWRSRNSSNQFLTKRNAGGTAFFSWTDMNALRCACIPERNCKTWEGSFGVPSPGLSERPESRSKGHTTERRDYSSRSFLQRPALEIPVGRGVKWSASGTLMALYNGRFLAVRRPFGEETPIT